MKQSQFQYLEGRKKRKEMVKSMNEELKKEMEKKGINEKFTVLKGKFDGHEYTFNGKKLVKKTLVLPEMKRDEVRIKVLFVGINQLSRKENDFFVFEFAGKVLSMGKDTKELSVGDLVIGRDLNQNCFKDLLVTNWLNVRKIEEENESELLNQLGNMSTAVLPYDLLKEGLTLNENDVVLIVGGGVVSQKLADLLQKRKIQYCIQVSEGLYSKYKTNGYNVVKEEEVDELLLKKINVIIDFSNNFEVFDDLNHNITYVYLNLQQTPTNISQLKSNETRSLSDAEGHASYFTFTCTTDNKRFFDHQKEARSQIRPHIASVVNIKDVLMVEKCLINREEDEETLVISF